MEAVTHALRWDASRGDSRTTHAVIVIDSMSLLKKKEEWKMEWKAHSRMCRCRWHPPSKTSVRVLPWTCRCEGKRPSRQTGGQSNPHKWLAFRKIWSVEKLETLPAGTKPRTSHHRSPGGERRGKIFLERTRESHRQSGEHWNRFKGNVGETSERRHGAHMGFSEPHRYHLKLNWKNLGVPCTDRTWIMLGCMTSPVCLH